MRVFAIRGENLASLATRFEVDLSAEPLARAGLFAITGPVGAGKSTLLDALCLPLFDRTPRLADRGGVMIGDVDDVTRISSHDVRGILRRGAGSGWAEVEFQGHTGKRLRARWSVRRARNRSDGRFQPQTISLVDVASEQEVGGSKTETLQRIEQELGLTFEQFRRSIMLAQGEFATFLRAKSADRAALLERMTDTSIYGDLSRRAHERASDVAREIGLLERERDAIAVLDEEARVELDARFAEADAAATRAEQLDKLLADRVALEREVTELEAAIESARREAEVAATAEQESSRVVDASRDAIRIHDAEVAARQPEIDTARRLDVAIAELTRSCEARGTELERNEGVLAVARRALRRGGDASMAELPADWADFQREVKRFAEVASKLRDAEQALESARGAREKAAAALAGAAARRDVAQTELDAVGGDPVDRSEELATRRDALDGVRERLQVLHRWSERAVARDTAVESREAAYVERGRADALVADCEQSVARSRTSLESARRKLESARRDRALDEYRGHLVEGEACPLCGATEHPRAHGEHAEDESVVDLAAAHDRAQELCTEQVSALAAARERARQAAGVVAHARNEWERAEAAVEEVRILADEARATFADETLPEAPAELEPECRERLARIDRELKEIKSHERDERARAQLSKQRKDAWIAALNEAQEGERDLRERDRAIGHFESARLELADRDADVRHALGEILDARAASLEVARAELESLRGDRTVKVSERGALLEGRSIEDVERQARERREQLEKDVDRARDGHAAVVKRAASATTARDGAVTRHAELAKRLSAHRDRFAEAARETGVDNDDDAVRQARERTRRARADLEVQRSLDDKARSRRGDLARRIETQRGAARPRLALAELIGSADGRKFRAFAQGLSFEHLIAHANRHLDELTPRYRLQRVAGEHLDLQVVDCEMGDEVRSIQSLSGGESFIVSLALALGLASMAARHVAFETLFIDEGLGTLDPDTLETVLSALDALQATGYQVGVISHVEGLAERVGARIEVVKLGGGRSEVRVVDSVRGELGVARREDGEESVCAS